MTKILTTKSIYYNDVNIIAQPSVVSSRSEIPKELNRVIVSPMHAVVGKEFLTEATKLGLTVCCHRFGTPSEQLDILNHCASNGGSLNNVFISVGLNDMNRLEYLKTNGSLSLLQNILIDVANGYLPTIRPFVHKIMDEYNPLNVMIGNIHSDSGIAMYENLGIVYPRSRFLIRVGIAGGAACATSDQTGVNRGQITEIMECSDSVLGPNFFVVADGGIKNANYAMKAFGSGAEYVMLGSYFANAEEAYTNVTGDGTYWGGASHKQQILNGGIKRHSEGKVLQLDKRNMLPLQTLVDDLWGGISSTISYSGYRTLTQFIGNATFELKQNSLPPTNR